jgi:hypothetical protein
VPKPPGLNDDPLQVQVLLAILIFTALIITVLIFTVLIARSVSA